MTKRDALIACWELWSWLAEHPGGSKCFWPGWKDESWGWVSWEQYFHCPCCVQCGHTADETPGACPDCVLFEYWRSFGSDFTDVPCEDFSSFSLWRASEGKDRAKYAQEIADAAWNELCYRGWV